MAQIRCLEKNKNTLVGYQNGIEPESKSTITKHSCKNKNY
jgi:hypothetical protein